MNRKKFIDGVVIIKYNAGAFKNMINWLSLGGVGDKALTEKEWPQAESPRSRQKLNVAQMNRRRNRPLGWVGK